MSIIVTILSVGCLLITGAILAAGLLLVGRHGPDEPSVRYAVVAGVAEVGGSAMYLVWLNIGGVAALTAANALLVLGPVMVVIAFHSLRPTSGGRVCVMIASASVVFVAVASLLMTAHAASLVRVAAFAVVCTCAVVTVVRSPEAKLRPIRLIAIGSGAYGLYCAVRTPVLLAVGPEAWLGGGVFSDPAAVVVGAAAVTAITTGTLWYWIGLYRRAHRAFARRASALVVVDTAAAEGGRRHPRVRELVSEVREAALAVDPGALPVDGGSGLSEPSAAAALVETLRVDHGWTAAELALLRLLDPPRSHPPGAGRPSAPGS